MERSSLGSPKSPSLGGGGSRGPVQYIHLRHPSKVFPRVPRRALARLVIVRPASSPQSVYDPSTWQDSPSTPDDQDHEDHFPFQKPTNRVKAGTSTLIKKVGRPKGVASTLHKQNNQVKAGAPAPLNTTWVKPVTPSPNKKANWGKSAASPRKEPGMFKATSPTLQKKRSAKNASAALLKKAQWTKSASKLHQKETGPAKTVCGALQNIPDQPKAASSALSRPAALVSSMERAEQAGDTYSSEKGTWTVRLLRLDPSLLKAQRAKAASSLQREAPQKRKVGRPKKIKVKTRWECDDDDYTPRKTLSSKVKKEVQQNSEQKGAKKRGRKPKIQNNSAVKRWDQSTDSKIKISKSVKIPEHPKKHAGELLYTCPECGKSFKYNATLINHQRAHIEQKLQEHSKREASPPNGINKKMHRTVKPMKFSKDKEKQSAAKPPPKTAAKKFTCSECGKPFSSKATMLQHQKVHARENMSMCNICGKTFSKASHLLVHRRVHTGYFACNECGKSFNVLANLKIHQKKHKGANPYTCNECGKSFKIPSYLQLHERIHTLEKWRDKRLSNSKKGSQRTSIFGTKSLKFVQ